MSKKKKRSLAADLAFCESQEDQCQGRRWDNGGHEDKEGRKVNNTKPPIQNQHLKIRCFIVLTTMK